MRKDFVGLVPLLRVFGEKVEGQGALGVVGARSNLLRVFMIAGLSSRTDLRLFQDLEQASTGLDLPP